MTVPHYDDPSGQTRFDSGLRYADALPPSQPGLGRRKPMDKLKTSYAGLDANETAALLLAHDTAMTGNASYPSPVPPKVDVTAMLTLLNGKITAHATAEENLNTAKTELDDTVLLGQQMIGQRATNCNSVTPGLTAALQSTGLPLIGQRQPAGPTPR